MLQHEAAELLQKRLGEPAKDMGLAVRTNGVVVVQGPIDSLESKLAVSRLFRQLSGCFGVVNELSLQQILRDGQRVVQVTRDGSMVVPLSALGLEPQQIVASPQAATPPMPLIPEPPTVPSIPVAATPSVVPPVPLTETPKPAKSLEKNTSPPAVPRSSILPLPRPTLPPPTPLPTKKPDTPKDEQPLPVAVAPKPANTRANPEPIKMSSVPDVLTAPKLPVKWGQPAASLEAQVKKLEPINVSPTPLPSRVSSADGKMPTPMAPKHSADRKKPDALATESKPKKVSKTSSLTFAETRVAPTPAMTWRHPSSAEPSEPKAQPVTRPTEARLKAPAKPKPSSVTTSSPPAMKGRHSGSEEGSEPKAHAETPSAVSHPVAPAQPKPAITRPASPSSAAPLAAGLRAGKQGTHGRHHLRGRSAGVRRRDNSFHCPGQSGAAGQVGLRLEGAVRWRFRCSQMVSCWSR